MPSLTFDRCQPHITPPYKNVGLAKVIAGHTAKKELLKSVSIAQPPTKQHNVWKYNANIYRS